MLRKLAGISNVTWRVALAEIAITTVGILIALALNSWWTHRQDRSTELLALREMKTTLSSDTIDLRLDLDRYEAIETANRALLAHISANEPYVASLDTVIGKLYIFRRHLSNTAPFEAIKAEGLPIIGNDSLRVAMLRYYALETTEIAMWNEFDNNFVFGEQLPYLRSRVMRTDTVPRRVARPLDAAALLRDPYFRNLLSDRLATLSIAIPAYTRTIAAAAALLGMIDRRIYQLSN